MLPLPGGYVKYMLSIRKGCAAQGQNMLQFKKEVCNYFDGVDNQIIGISECLNRHFFLPRIVIGSFFHGTSPFYIQCVLKMLFYLNHFFGMLD